MVGSKVGPIPEQKAFPGEVLVPASTFTPFLWMMLAIPAFMVLGLVQIRCFPFLALRPMTYAIGIIGGFISTYFYIKALRKRGFIMVVHGKEISVSTTKLVCGTVVTFCFSTLIVGFGVWMLLGDAIVFTSKEKHEYVTKITGLGYGGRGCRSGAIGFYDPHLARDISICGDTFIDKPVIDESIKVVSYSGALGVKVTSFKRID
jgi:hypothetical protein